MLSWSKIRDIQTDKIKGIFIHRILLLSVCDGYGIFVIREKLKQMIREIIYFLAFWICLLDSVNGQSLSKVGLGYSRTSVNTTVFRQSSVVTHGDMQYIAYYDTACYLVVGKRSLNNGTWDLHRSQYTGHCQDAHNIISIGVDGDGFLHVAFDHHGHKLNYCKSIAPGSLELGEKIPMTGLDEEDVTYPEFYNLKDGDLIFAYRSGASGRGNLVLNRYLTQVKQWTRLHVEHPIIIDGENNRNAYWQLFVDNLGTIHLSWVWRETWHVETNHDLCYARSRDGGKTWEKSTGEKYVLPITASTAEYAFQIPQGSELINQTSMTADEDGNPYIATYWRDADSKVPQYRLVYRDSTGWQMNQVFRRVTPFSLSGGGTKSIPISRPRLVIERDSLTGKYRACYIFRDEERGRKVSVAETDDLRQGQWTVRDLTSFSVEAWEPGFDLMLWKKRKILHLFVQHTVQGDGEQQRDIEPQPVYILEYEPFKK